MDFENLGILELRELARGKVKGFSSMSKAVLLEALRALSPTEGGEVKIASDLPVETAQLSAVGAQITCPRCGANDTVAYSVHGVWQYRRCQRAVCRHSFSVRREYRLQEVFQL
jgi:transposase-like protein